MIGNRIPGFAIDYGALSNVYHIKTASAVGTCFIFERKGKGWFVSAAHVLKGVQPDELIYFGKGDAWESHRVLEIARHPGAPEVDVCCFTVENPPTLHKGNAEQVEESFLFPGEEVKFVGFPHGLSITPLDPNDYRHGLVRTAFLSGVIDKKSVRTWIFDGFNNPGYSGGPIYKYLADGKTTWCGVVSGFLFEREDQGKLYKRVDEETHPVENYFVKQNSGMIYAFGLAEIRHTGELLNSPYEIEAE